MKKRTNRSVAAPPYAPSWVDRLTGFVRRLPIPPWVTYLLLWVGLILLHVSSEWIDGSQPVGRVERWQFFFASWPPYLLASIHYLDEAARKALAAALPALRLHRDEVADVGYRLTTMPRAAIRRISVLMIAALALGLTLLTRMTGGVPSDALDFSATPLSIATDVVALAGLSAILSGAFVYHTVRQLRIVGEIYSRHSAIDLFRLRPLYSLSGITVRNALALVGLAYIYVLGVVPTYVDLALTSPASARSPLAFSLVLQTGVLALLAAACLVLPVTGIHRLMVDERAVRQAELDRRMDAVLTEMHRHIDRGRWRAADSFQRVLSSLVLEREVVSKIPTWPWNPGAPGALLSAVLLPVAIWIIQRLLDRFM